MDLHKKPPNVEAILLAGGVGSRLEMGPKAFVKLGELTLLDRAVQTMLEITDRVIVALPSNYLEAENQWANDSRVTFISGGERRIDTLRLLVNSCKAEWIILHDVVHPFVSAQVTEAVLNKAYKHGCAASAINLQEFVYSQAGNLVAKPGQAYLVQKPIVFRNLSIKAGFAKADSIGLVDDVSVLDILALSGVIPYFVPCITWSQKITTASDLQYAEELMFSTNNSE